MTIKTISMQQDGTLHFEQGWQQATELHLKDCLGRLTNELTAKLLKEKFYCERLVFDGKGVGDVELSSAMTQIDFLQSKWGFSHLGLNRCQIGDQAVTTLHCPSGVTSLSLAQNHLQGVEVAQLLSNHPQLTSLDVSSNQFMHPDRTLTAILEKLQDHRLQALTFKDTGLSGGLADVPSVLAHYPVALNQLDLSGNPINHQDKAALLAVQSQTDIILDGLGATLSAKDEAPAPITPLADVKVSTSKEKVNAVTTLLRKMRLR